MRFLSVSPEQDPSLCLGAAPTLTVLGGLSYLVWYMSPVLINVDLACIHGAQAGQ